MKRFEDSQGREHIEVTTREAHQARRGKPILFVLIGGIAGTLVGIGIVSLLS